MGLGISSVWVTLKETEVNLLEANRLARICAYSTDESEWSSFVRVISPIVVVAARRIGASWGDPSPSTVSEIAQEVFLKLCDGDRRILREFEDRGNDSFLKLLRMITASVGTDHFRRLKAEKRGGRGLTTSLDDLGPAREVADQNALSALEWPTLMGQLDKLLRQFPDTVTARDRNLFWLYYRQGFTADAISRIPDVGLGAKGVESALLRMARLLRECVSGGGPRSESQKPPHTDSPVRGQKGFRPVVAIDNLKRR